MQPRCAMRFESQIPKSLAMRRSSFASDAKTHSLDLKSQEDARKKPAKILRCCPAMQKKSGCFLRSSVAKCLRFGLPLRFGLRCERPRCQIANDVGRAMRTTKMEGQMKIFHVGSHQFRESLRELLRELWFSYCSSHGMPFREWNFVFREWNFEFRELLREYPGTLPELREWSFHSESFFPEIGVVPRLLKIDDGGSLKQSMLVSHLKVESMNRPNTPDPTLKTFASAAQAESSRALTLFSCFFFCLCSFAARKEGNNAHDLEARK